jgi:hypothetical protein
MGLQFKIIVFVKMLFENKIWMANAQVFFLGGFAFFSHILCIFFPFLTTNLKFTRKCQQQITQTSTNLIIVCLIRND